MIALQSVEQWQHKYDPQNVVANWMFWTEKTNCASNNNEFWKFSHINFRFCLHDFSVDAICSIAIDRNTALSIRRPIEMKREYWKEVIFGSAFPFQLSLINWKNTKRYKQINKQPHKNILNSCWIWWQMKGPKCKFDVNTKHKNENVLSVACDEPKIRFKKTVDTFTIIFTQSIFECPTIRFIY